MWRLAHRAGEENNVEAKTKISARSLNLYYGENHALKDISLDLYEHKITAFIGP